MSVEAPDRQSKAALEKRLARAEKALTASLETVLTLTDRLETIRVAASGAPAVMKRLNSRLSRT